MLGFEKLSRLNHADIAFDEVVGLQIPFFDGFGFPPALIPVANSMGSSSYFGAYVYNIIEPRLCFVDLMVNEQEVFEIGLDEKQFSHYLVRRAMRDYFEEGSELSTEFSRFSTLLGVENASALALISDEDFLKLEAFKTGIPKYFLDHKAGTTQGTTGFDLASKGENTFPDMTSSFDSAFYNGDFQKSWNILNSPGWSIDLAKTKFTLLVDAADNEVISSLYDAWIAVNHPKDGY